MMFLSMWPTSLRSALALTFASLACVPTTTAIAQNKRALLSIDGLNLTPDQYVASFRLTTWNVNVLSACRLPISWKVEVDKLQEPEGLLTARADIHGERLREFGQLFLVEISDAKASVTGAAPAPFSGSVNIVSTEADSRRIHRKLKAENFHLSDAASCPAPDVAGK